MADTAARQRVGPEHFAYRFSADAPPAATVEPGEQVTVVTRDAYDGAFEVDLDIRRYLRERDRDKTNPVTGPIALNSAKLGDAIRVEIQDIRLGHTGYVAATPGNGLLGSNVVEPTVCAFQVRGRTLLMDGGFRLPLRPMIGTIGVAPAEGDISSLAPGYHGGNLDIAQMTVGTTLHFPVWHPGGLLSLGDVHASMGFGEGHSGVNISAEVDLQIEIEKGARLSRPWFETRSEIMTIGVADDLIRALREAAAEMERELSRRLGATPNQARILTGSTVDLRLGQCGGYGVPVSAFAAFPKSVFARLSRK